MDYIYDSKRKYKFVSNFPHFEKKNKNAILGSKCRLCVSMNILPIIAT